MRAVERTGAVFRVGLMPSVIVVLCVVIAGCGDRVNVSPPEKLRAFEAAAKDGPAVDLGRIMRAKLMRGPYRVVAGDVLQLELPVVLYPGAAVAEGTGSRTACNCRVDEAGTITLPDGRQVAVAGHSLAEIEAAVVSTYYPDLVKTRPAVYARVLEYQGLRVQIVGAVASPGIYTLRHDQMSLVGLLMQAGGIVDGGAALIRISRRTSDDTGQESGAEGDGWGGSEVKAVHGASVTDDWSRGVRITSVRFRQEGPLATTGWLSVEGSGEVLARKWLDIGSADQVKAILRETAVRSGPEVAVAVGERVSRLAAHLDRGGRGTRVRPAVYDPCLEWERANAGGFATYLGGRSAEHAGPGPDVPVKLTKTIPEEPGSAVGGGTEREKTLVLPVRGLNIPLTDVPLREGDVVVVERPQLQYVSVLGLVQGPGRFPYPPNSQLTLAEALASAGGVDLVANPRYVCVYRLRSDGTVVSATYELAKRKNQESLTEALALKLKPGDVVSVEHTPRTRTNLFLDRVFRISLGLYFRPEEIWE